MPGQLFMIYRS